MQQPPSQPLLLHLRIKYRWKYDAGALLLYTLLVCVFGMSVYPLGRDYAHFASSGGELPFLASTLFRWEMTAFGTNVVPYHIVNLVLLYLCTLLVYALAALSIQGNDWVRIVSATLFMANPIHAESFLNLSGVGDLIPCLAGLAALCCYAWDGQRPHPAKKILVLLTMLWATWAYPPNLLLVAAAMLYELLAVPAENRSKWRVLIALAASIPGWFLHFPSLLEQQPALGQRFGVLYFIFYNIGLLPENVLLFHTRPWVAWLAVAAVIIGLILIARKVRRKLLLFVLLSMVVLRLGPVERPVDPVHLIGGGQLLLETALYSLGLMVIFLRMMDHPRWRMTTIGFTTFLCIVFFIMHIRQDLLWREAGLYVRHVQQTAMEQNQDDGNIGLCPDFQNYKGAPVHLSKALQYETPFSPAFNVETLMPMHYLSDGIEIERKIVSLKEMHIMVYGVAPMEFLTFPYELAEEGGTWENGQMRVTTTSVDDESLSWRVESKDEALPALILPLVGEKTGGETE